LFGLWIVNRPHHNGVNTALSLLDVTNGETQGGKIEDDTTMSILERTHLSLRSHGGPDLEKSEALVGVTI
jgi:hypothetical protein